jgi:excisionase family DNA binding protein
MINGREILTPQQVAVWLDVDEDEVKSMVEARQIPHARIGRIVRFVASSLIEWREADERRRLAFDRLEEMRDTEPCPVDKRSRPTCTDCRAAVRPLTPKQRTWAWSVARQYKVCESLVVDWAGDWTCPLCGKDISEAPRLDHDHETGLARGVICGSCNYGLSFVDRPAWLERALAYVEREGNSARWVRVSEPQNGAANGVEPQRKVSRHGR